MPNKPIPTSDRTRDQRGIVLIVLAAAAAALLGAAGLALDLGRFYVVKAELQNFTDASSISAAHQLDGTTAGLAAAADEVAVDPNRWAFGTQSVSSYVVEFALAADGPFVAAPGVAAGYRYVRVTASASPNNTFARILPGVGATTLVRASSVAGQVAVTGLGDGVLPYSPDAHDPLDVTGNYGFLLGRQYTLRWDNRVGGNAPPDSFKTSIDGVELVGCDADMTSASFQPGETSNSQRGYIDLADLNPLTGGGGAALIKNTIASKVSFEKQIVPFQYWVTPEPGEKQTTLRALQDRASADTDTTSTRFFTTAQTAAGVPSAEVMKSTYRDATTYRVGDQRPPDGNGRRIVTVPVNDPQASGVVLGFAGFLLPTTPCAEVRVGNKKYYPCCGEYIGPVTRTGRPSAGSGGLFEVALVR